MRRALASDRYDVVVEDVNKLPLYLAGLTTLPFVVIGEDYRVIAVNEAFRRLRLDVLGFTESDLVKLRKYITELSATGRLPVFRQGRGWRLADNARLEIPPVRFHLEEAAALCAEVRDLLQQAYPEPAAA